VTKILELCNITKRFPGVLANDNVCLDIEEGEIHALLGENGAGKSTLMNCLCGLYQPQEGEFYLAGEKVEIASTADSVALGIGMIHQHFMLVPQLTVAENVASNLRDRDKILVNLACIRDEIIKISKETQLQVDPDAYIWQLSVGVQQRVEIIRALMAGANVLILDEPTAVLTPQEVVELFDILDGLHKAGKTIIFISHKLDEAMQISDRITVLRDGKVVDTVKTSETNTAELARMMVGREVLFRVSKSEVQCGEPVLEVHNLEALDSRGLPALQKISFHVCHGEILGIAGVDGNGQLELAEVIAGLRPANGGQVCIEGEDITNCSPRETRRKGLGYVPAERQTVGAILEFSIEDNLVLATYDMEPYSKAGWLNRKEISSYAEDRIQSFDVRTPSKETMAGDLSGGNLQKVVLARELSLEPPVLLCAQPTRGLDVGAIEYVHNRILEQRDKSAAVLLISTELDEVLTLSDRIAVLYQGRIMGIIPNEDVDIEQLGLMMAGTLDLFAESEKGG
jgi:general nucleoside transport system ATP-binding protein